jgi:hypothetical protein
MVRQMLAASAALLFVVGLATAADEKKADPNQVTGKLVKCDAEKGEITINVKDKDMTYQVAKDAKVSVGEVKDFAKLKAGQLVTLTLKKDGDKTMVTEVTEGKPNGSGKN